MHHIGFNQFDFNTKAILKKIISPFYYLPYNIELAKRKKGGDIFLPEEREIKAILGRNTGKYTGIVSGEGVLKKIKKENEISWICKYIREWIRAEDIRSGDTKRVYIFIELFAYPKMAKRMHEMGLHDGTDFMLLFDGEKYRSAYQEESIQRKWMEVERLRKINKEPWLQRIVKMRNLIGDGNTSVLDIGCWECELAKYLPSHMKYYGCDYVKRREDTIICDLNDFKFPDIVFDVAYISGSLEYMENLEWYFDHVCLAQKEVILSYSSLEYFPLIHRRKRKSWVNHLTTMEIITYMHERKFVLTKSDFWGKWTVILKFERMD